MRWVLRGEGRLWWDTRRIDFFVFLLRLLYRLLFLFCLLPQSLCYLGHSCGPPQAVLAAWTLPRVSQTEKEARVRRGGFGGLSDFRRAEKNTTRRPVSFPRKSSQTSPILEPISRQRAVAFGHTEALVAEPTLSREGVFAFALTDVINNRTRRTQGTSPGSCVGCS
jgi:hypothetical protein